MLRTSSFAIKKSRFDFADKLKVGYVRYKHLTQITIKVQLFWRLPYEMLLYSKTNRLSVTHYVMTLLAPNWKLCSLSSNLPLLLLDALLFPVQCDNFVTHLSREPYVLGRHFKHICEHFFKCCKFQQSKLLTTVRSSFFLGLCNRLFRTFLVSTFSPCTSLQFLCNKPLRRHNGSARVRIQSLTKLSHCRKKGRGESRLLSPR